MQRFSSSRLVSNCKNAVTRNISTSCKLDKFANTYGNPVPPKVEVQTRQKIAPWQRIQRKGRGFDKEVEYLQKDDSYISDPARAKQIADDKMKSFEESLLAKGFCRETTPYDPPENLEMMFSTICQQVFKESNVEQCLDKTFADLFEKFNFVKSCNQAFDHELPNSQLHKIKNVRHVYEFFQTPVRGVNTLDSLEADQRQNKLPKNLHVLKEYIRYNPDNDTFFDGKDAYPNMPYTVSGLRASKKYDSYKTPFEWPDI